MKSRLATMREHQIEPALLRRVIPDDDRDEHRNLEKSIVQAQHDERYVQRVAWVVALFLLLALACIAYGLILYENFPYNGSERVFRILCAVVLASLLCLVAFAVLLIVYRRKLNRLRDKCRQLAMTLVESRPGKAHRAPLPKSDRVHGTPLVGRRAGSTGSPNWST